MTVRKIDAGYVVAYQDGAHRLLTNGTVVTSEDQIIFVGRDYTGPFDEHVSVRDMLVTPGFINTHSHLETSPLDRSVQEDCTPRQFFYTGLVDVLMLQEDVIDDDGRDACVAFSMAELIRTGTTTVMHQGLRAARVAEACGEAGIRAYVADGYRSGRWYTPDGLRVEYEWLDDEGIADLDRASELVRRLNSESGLVRGFLCPWQANTCSPRLLRESQKRAEELDVPVSIHAGQAVFELLDILERTGKTPIEYLEDTGLLSPRVILGHAIFLSGNSWLNLPGNDAERIAKSGASISHNVWTFARKGMITESLPAYRDAGINITLGTDTSPQSMLESIRWSAVLAKIADRRVESWTASDALNAATVNAANALGREDLGRIAPGAKADILFWRLDSMSMTPVRDPIRNLVYYASKDDLSSVMINGSWVMRDGDLLTVDESKLASTLQETGDRSWARVPERDRFGRTIEEVSPASLPPFVLR